MDVKEKLVELLTEFYGCDPMYYNVDALAIADHLVSNGVTVQECGEWVHPKEASYYPINPRPGGAYIADENGNFFYPPKLNYCPNCGAKMMPLPQPPKGD